MNENDNKFNMYLEKINKAFNSDPNNNYSIIEKYAERLVGNKENNNIKIDFKAQKILMVLCLCFSIMLIGFFNINGLLFYFFGAVFFFAGLFIGLYVNFFGLIFLFSHGGTGLMMMSGTLLGNDFIEFIGPVFSDGSSSNLFIMFSMIILFYILGVIFTILHNLTKFRKMKFAVLIPISCFGVGLLLCGLFPYIIK